MRHSLFPIATAILGAALLAPSLQAQAPAATATKTTTTAKARRTRRPIKKGPTVEQQIQSLRTDMEQQIQTLQQQLTQSQTQLQQAQAAATAAQQSAQQAQAQSAQQAQTLTDNTTAVSSLQGAVTDLKTSSSSLQTMVTDNQAKVQKQIDHPDVLHYKGVTLSPNGSFIEAANVYRTHATGSDIPTPFTSIPLENTDGAKLSEFYGTARQSRLALMAEGKLDNATIRGYYEMDWLGTGVTSNNNQSNSYVMRLRQIWAQAELNSGWTFSTGQMWSLATQYKKGLTLRTENNPQTIDPNYNAGFVWERQYGARVVRSFDNKVWLGLSIENPETLSPSGSGLPVNYLIGSAGTGGGLYNSAGAPGATSSPNLANYSWNVAPDMIAKIAFEPGFGHYEVFGIGRFFRNRIYPGNTTTTSTTTTGGVTTTTTTVVYNSIGAYTDKTVGGGLGGSFQLPVMKDKLSVGLSGLWGQGVGRYGASQIGDLTLRPNAQIALLHGFSALASVDFNPTPRLSLYANYGGDENFRRYFYTNAAQTKAEGYGSPLAVQTGCFTEPAPGATPTAGFTPGSQSNCAANTRGVEEGTVGYWYDFYKGDKGRFRQGIQYSYFDKLTFSGVPNTFGRAPMGNDNVIETSFRYYLP
jgi:hypothetical protein